MKTSEIKIFVDEELPMQEAIKRLSDEFILQGGYCDQTVIDLRDLSLYLLGRSSAMERLYRYTLAPPTSLEQVDELIRLKEWFDGAILTTPTRGKMMKEYKERIRHACGHTVEYVTAYKIERRLVKQKRQTDCAKCQLNSLMVVERNREERRRPLIDEYDEQH